MTEIQQVGEKNAYEHTSDDYMQSCSISYQSVNEHYNNHLDGDIQTVDIETTDDSLSAWKSRKMFNWNFTKKIRKLPKEDIPDLNYELLNAYKIIQYLKSPTNKNANWPFLDEKNYHNNIEIKNAIWLNRIKSRLLEGKYNSITEVICDIRLMLENCYRSFGQTHTISKRAMKLEMLLEQKLALLSREIKEKTLIEITSVALVRESRIYAEGRRLPTIVSTDTSPILFYINNAKIQKEKENRKRHIEEKKAEKQAEYVGIIDWESQLMREDVTTLKAMWEIPQIGHFLFLAQKTLNIPELHMYALERVFFMPRESVYLATIITSLLSSPCQRTKLDRKPPMPYQIWHERVKSRIQNWYKLFYKKRKNARKVFDIIGVEPDFFRILGDSNPLLNKEFHELNIHQRVWIVKALCDYCLHNHKTVQDAINDNPSSDQKECILGRDRYDKSYVHFPQFCGLDLRIYRQSSHNEMSLPNFFLHSKSHGSKKAKIMHENKKNKDKNFQINGNINRSKKYKWKNIQPDINKFELVVDGVETLKNLIAEFSNNENKTLEKKNKEVQIQCEIELHKTLCNLLDELEPWESKLQQVVKRSRMRLKKEWDDYQLKQTKGNEQEVLDDVWECELEECCNDVLYDSNIEDMDDYNSSISLNNDSSDEDDNFDQNNQRMKHERCYFSYETEEESGNTSEFDISISSRGRVRKIRKLNISDEENPFKTFRKNNQKIRSSASKTKNNNLKKDYLSKTTQAQGQYEWETLRQLIISSKKTDYHQEEMQENNSSCIKNIDVKDTKTIQKETQCFVETDIQINERDLKSVKEFSFNNLLNKSDLSLCIPPCPKEIINNYNNEDKKIVSKIKNTSQELKKNELNNQLLEPKSFQTYIVNKSAVISANYKDHNKQSVSMKDQMNNKIQKTENPLSSNIISSSNSTKIILTSGVNNNNCKTTPILVTTQNSAKYASVQFTNCNEIKQSESLVNNTQVYLKMIQKSASSQASHVTKSITTNIPSSLQLKSIPPPLGPITSFKNSSNQLLIKSKKKDNEFFQLPPLTPIILSDSSTLKKSSETTVQRVPLKIDIPNLFQNKNQSLSSNLSNNSNQSHVICENIPSITLYSSNMTPSNQNVQLMKYRPSVPATFHTILKSGNCNQSSITLTKPVILSQTIVPNNMQLNSRNKKMVPNILVKHTSSNDSYKNLIQIENVNQQNQYRKDKK